MNDHPSARDRRIQLADHATAVDDRGHGREPFVFVHAIGLDHRMWDTVVTALAGRHRTVAYDVRGHGSAADAPHPITIARLADDVLALLDALDIERARLVGLSFGGAIAQQFALDHPERISSLALLCTFMTSSRDAALGRASAAEADGMAAQVDVTLRRWFSPTALSADIDGVRYARERLLSNSVRNWAAAWRALADVDFADRLPSLRMPVHVIAGADDQSTPPAAMKGIADRIPGAQFTVVPSGVHMLSLELPAHTAQVIVNENA